MAEPFIGEIRAFPFNFAPRGWAQCKGQLLPISSNQALYALLGTQNGGDGRTNFALPNLQGRTPIGVGNNVGQSFLQGRLGGSPTSTMATAPSHTHTYSTMNLPAADKEPSGKGAAASIAIDPAENFYSDTANTTLNRNTLANAGGGQAFDNRQPYLTVNYCVALLGLFPSRN